MWLLLTAAVAAPSVDLHPWAAQVDLAPTGIQRIHVPREMHDTEHRLRSGNLVLLDGRGSRVPFAVLDGGARWETTLGTTSYAGDDDEVGIWPTAERNRFNVAIRKRVQEKLEVFFDDADYAVTARLLGADGQVIDTALLWRMGSGTQHGALTLPPRLGQFTLELLTSDGEAKRPTVRGLRQRLTYVPDETVDLTPVRSGVQQEGWARYDLDVGHSYPITSVELDVSNDLFKRTAGVAVVDPHILPGSLPTELYPSVTSTIRRVKIGGSHVHETVVNAPSNTGANLALLVEINDNKPPLDVVKATGRFDGLHLVVRNPGPGPHTLYGGGEHLEPLSDLQFAAAELEREARGVVETDAVTPNPAYVPPEARGGLGEPGRVASLRGYRYHRAVEGPVGLVRIPVDDAVLEHARPDLGDLRLVDEEDRQIPFVIRRDGLEHTWGDLPFTTEQRDDTTLLRVPIDRPNVAIGTISLTTPAPIFSRRVRVARERGPQLETLRAFTWTGDGQPGTLSLAVNQALGDQLIVLIDNGDDPPLPIEAIRADWPGWELLAVLPESGKARLVYGNRTARAPTYDFRMLGKAIGRRAQATASVGPEASVGSTPLSFLDRLMLAVGVGVMALGLLGLALILLRGSATAPDDADDDVDPDSDEHDGEPSDSPEEEGVSATATSGPPDEDLPESPSLP